MATYTENYNLEKPAQSDLYNIDVFNENADKIDEALGDKAENQSLAPIESSATASRNYSVGQQFVYNGLLYEATSAIASGGTITPGSNCARTTVAEELSALNDALNTTASLVDGNFAEQSIISYQSASNVFTAPSDGYVMVNHNVTSVNAGNAINVFINGKLLISLFARGYGSRDGIFVKKNSKVYHTQTGFSAETNYWVMFYPFTYKTR